MTARPAFLGLGGGRRLAGPRDRLPDQLFDRADRFLVGWRDDGHRRAAAARTAGAADAMHIVVGMMGYVEIEHMAHRRDIEPARRHVGGDQQADLAAAELVQRRRAGRLIHVAMERDGGETMLDERTVQQRDLALAVQKMRRW